jgi:hypothetical protein
METLILYNNMTFLQLCICQTIRFLQSGMFGHWIFYNFVFVDRGTYSPFWRVLNYCVWQFGNKNIPGSGSLAVCWSAAGVSVLPFDDMRVFFGLQDLATGGCWCYTDVVPAVSFCYKIRRGEHLCNWIRWGVGPWSLFLHKNKLICFCASRLS